MESTLRILFVGVGSIAKRHIVNAYRVCKEKGKDACIDVYRSSKRELDEEIKIYVSNVFYSYDEVPSGYDVIFITNPTEYHLDALYQLHDKGKSFFFEKPICTVEQLGNLIPDFLREDKLYYVACPLRYTKVLQYVKNNVETKDVYSVRCISSSYLPDWRPGTDYRQTYSAQKALGGGVAIDLIHEWDYINYLFGAPEKVFSFRNKKSHLEIDTEDIAVYIGEYQDKMVELHLDYFGRKSIRKMELFSKEETIECNLIASEITYLKRGKTIEFGEERNSFQMEEMRHFFDLVLSGKKENAIPEAMRVLKLTRGER